MSNTTAKSTLLVENDPDPNNWVANQALKPWEYPEQVKGLERLRKLVHAVQSAVRSLTCPNDLLLAGKMGRMIGKQEQAVEPNQIAMFNSLSPGSAGQHPVWQDSPGNFDG
jgi:hypothetical protein